MNGLSNEALGGLMRMQKSLKRQEANQPPPIKTGYGTISNPILTAEIEAVFDTPQNVGTDFIGLIVDSVNGWQSLVWTDGVTWYSSFFGCCDYSWPGWYVVDSTGSYPGSYLSIQDVLDDTVGTVKILLLTTSSDDVNFTNRNVTIHGIIDGTAAIGSHVLSGDITITATTATSLQLSNLRTIGKIQLTGSSLANFFVNNCHLTLDDSSGTAVNGCLYNATTGTTSIIDTNIVSSANTLPAIYSSGPLYMSTCRFQHSLNGGGTGLYVNNATFELTRCHFQTNRTGLGSILHLQVAPAALSIINYCTFYTNIGAVSITTTPGWNPARFYFNQASVAWAAAIVPVATAFNTVG